MWAMASSFLSFYIKSNDAAQLVGLLWTSDRLVARTSTWQHIIFITNIHGPSGVRNRNFSRRATPDPRLRLRGHWDWRKKFNDDIWGSHIRVHVEVSWHDIMQIGKYLSMLRWKLLPTFRAVQKHFPEVGGNKLLRNVGNNSPVYTVLYPTSIVYSVYQDFTRYVICTKTTGFWLCCDEVWSIITNLSKKQAISVFRTSNLSWRRK